MKKNNKSILILVTLILILFSFIVNIDVVISSFISYTNTFFIKLFPVSFITYLIIYMLIEYGLFEFLNSYLHIKSCGLFIFVLSLLSGFPSGSKYSLLLYDKGIIDSKTASNYLYFSHFPNILFVLGTVKSIINDATVTYYLLFSIILSNFIIFVFTKHNNFNISFNHTSKSFSKTLGDGIIYSIKTLIMIYGTSIFFYLISVILLNRFSSNLYIYVFFNGIFDLTNGVVSCGLINSVFIRAFFILLFLSFGSISIHIQVKEITDNKLSYYNFFKGRIIGTIMSSIIFIILFFH